MEGAAEAANQPLGPPVSAVAVCVPGKLLSRLATFVLFIQLTTSTIDRSAHGYDIHYCIYLFR